MYYFGDLCVDEERFEIRRGDRTVPIEPLALELVLYLIANRMRMVSKSELMSRLWNDACVTESALTRCVCVARKALGDPSLIKTIHRRGYAWSEPLTQGSVAPHAASRHHQHIIAAP